jgi:hypothetical protein
MSYLLETLTKKEEIDNLIRNTIDKVLVLRIGRASDIVCMQLDEIVSSQFFSLVQFNFIYLHNQFLAQSLNLSCCLGFGMLGRVGKGKEEQMTSMLPPAFHLRGSNSMCNSEKGIMRIILVQFKFI